MTKRTRARIPRNSYLRIVNKRKSSEGVKSPSERKAAYRRNNAEVHNPVDGGKP